MIEKIYATQYCFMHLFTPSFNTKRNFFKYHNFYLFMDYYYLSFIIIKDYESSSSSILNIVFNLYFLPGINYNFAFI